MSEKQNLKLEEDERNDTYQSPSLEPNKIKWNLEVYSLNNHEIIGKVVKGHLIINGPQTNRHASTHTKEAWGKHHIGP